MTMRTRPEVKKEALEITFTKELITPEAAREYLAKNTNLNRNVSPTQIQAWATDMKAGRWKVTHQGIAFDSSGSMIDGQHRLEAVVLADVAVEMIVARNCDPATFKVIDSGRFRSSANLFAIMFRKKHGEMPQNVTNCAAIARAMMKRLAGHGGGAVAKEAIAKHTMQHYELIQELMPLTRSPVGTVGVVAAFANACLYFGEERIRPLAARFKSEMWLAVDDPLKVLHTRLLRAKLGSKRGNDRSHILSKGEHYGLTVGAIRACLGGVKLTRLESTTRDFGDAADDVRQKNSK